MRNIFSEIKTMAIGPSTGVIAIGCSTGEVCIIENGNVVKFSKTHDAGVSKIIFSLDDQFLYSSSHDGSIYKWNVQQRKLVGTFESHSSHVAALCVTRD